MTYYKKQSYTNSIMKIEEENPFGKRWFILEGIDENEEPIWSKICGYGGPPGRKISEEEVNLEISKLKMIMELKK